MNTRKFVIMTRHHLRMTHEEFAYEIGSSLRSVYRWENGETEPSGSTVLEIMKLCKERGIKLDDLVFLFFLTYLTLLDIKLCFIIKIR